MPLDPQAALAALNAEQMKLNQAQQAYREADPQGSMNAQVQSDSNNLTANYLNPKRAEAEQALHSYTQAGRTLQALQTVAAPSNLYKETLQKEAEHLTKEQSQLTQKIRTHRRSFMDALPESGTGSFGTSHTADDSAMFFLLLGVAAVYFVAFFKVLPQFSNKVVLSLVGFVVVWFVVNQVILYLG